MSVLTATITKTRSAVVLTPAEIDAVQAKARPQDNFPAAAPGEGFYPEMGGRHDGTALFISQIGYGGYDIHWSPERHTEALAAFKSLRIRPRGMESYKTIKGAERWSAGVTWEAGRKLQDAKFSVLEMLLD